jgi:hypothetical protein
MTELDQFIYGFFVGGAIGLFVISVITVILIRRLKKK